MTVHLVMVYFNDVMMLKMIVLMVIDTEFLLVWVLLCMLGHLEIPSSSISTMNLRFSVCRFGWCDFMRISANDE